MPYACVVLVDRRGWVLLQERDQHPVIDPEKWGYPGGGVEGAETYEQTAYRELAEETGVRLDGGLESILIDEPGECAIFAGASELTDADIVCTEGRRIVFIDPDVARGLDLTAVAARTLPAFLDSDAYRRLVTGG